ncbi:tRNA uridine-5-carboxymethylaminomethyl(34) synthesis GTPase MnmE [Oryzifoliimicrobium ureilyticus]|uniref:tRNA uridine-5-carboxymethylaminomethyl(34) synthesis GTPase MnmE n=1 Tax=Oryzifoliimicrobium ureilyticus TaxID=3113724 RepID=UPI00307640F2
MTASDTIFALSSGAVPAGVAVIRLSGAMVPTIVKDLTGSLPSPRRASLRTIHDRNGVVLDEALVIFFPAPNSFTGEDFAELQVHGSRAVLAALYNCLQSFQGTRLADAGEFSRRAFDYGKLDLVEVEGLADLIAAETEMQRRLAQEHSFGRLSKLYDSWTERLTRGRALIEAELDFPDEEDVPGSVSSSVWDDISHLAREIGDHCAGSQTGEIIRDGFKVVIAGRPNAGKSSLLNAIAKRDVAIVTDIAGTTRDVIHIDLDMEGYLVKLFDTAGLRETEDIVEREGIRRAQIELETADLVLYLEDMSAPSKEPVDRFVSDTIRIGTKRDRASDNNHNYDLAISTSDVQDLDKVCDAIVSRLRKKLDVGTFLLPVRARQRQWLQACAEQINFALDAKDDPLDIRAEYLRRAGDMLGRITGRKDADDLLDIVFSQFCIGK